MLSCGWEVAELDQNMYYCLGKDKEFAVGTGATPFFREYFLCLLHAEKGNLHVYHKQSKSYYVCFLELGAEQEVPPNLAATKYKEMLAAAAQLSFSQKRKRQNHEETMDLRPEEEVNFLEQQPVLDLRVSAKNKGPETNKARKTARKAAMQGCASDDPISVVLSSSEDDATDVQGQGEQQLGAAGAGAVIGNRLARAMDLLSRPRRKVAKPSEIGHDMEVEHSQVKRPRPGNDKQPDVAAGAAPDESEADSVRGSGAVIGIPAEPELVSHGSSAAAAIASHPVEVHGQGQLGPGACELVSPSPGPGVPVVDDAAAAVAAPNAASSSSSSREVGGSEAEPAIAAPEPLPPQAVAPPPEPAPKAAPAAARPAPAAAPRRGAAVEGASVHNTSTVWLGDIPIVKRSDKVTDPFPERSVYGFSLLFAFSLKFVLCRHSPSFLSSEQSFML